MAQLDTRNLLCTTLEVDPTWSKPASMLQQPVSTSQQKDRTFQSQSSARYWLPDDVGESSRLSIQHNILLVAFQGFLHYAPLDTSKAMYVLDVGTGPGQWAIEFAQRHPKSTVLGIDLSEVEKRADPALWASKPSNVSFLVHNAESNWNFGPQFDYIHARALVLGLRDWPAFFKRTYDALQLGGWFESVEPEWPISILGEFDNTVSSEGLNNGAFDAFTKYAHEAAGKMGIDFLVGRKLRPMIEAQGFVNIRQETLKFAVGPWVTDETEKRLSLWALEDTMKLLESTAPLLEKALDWDKQKLEGMLSSVRAELDGLGPGSYRYYYQIHLICGQKPE